MCCGLILEEGACVSSVVTCVIADDNFHSQPNKKHKHKMANQKPKTHRHNETVKQLPPAEQPSQGISGKLFGLFKKFPMQLTSPSKEVLPQDDSQSEQERSNSEQDQEEEEEDEDEDEDDEDEDKDESEQEIVTESEQEDPLGDEQCKAIMENYLLESKPTPHWTNFQ